MLCWRALLAAFVCAVLCVCRLSANGADITTPAAAVQISCTAQTSVNGGECRLLAADLGDDVVPMQAVRAGPRPLRFAWLAWLATFPIGNACFFGCSGGGCVS